jgi:WD40 repeat protein
MMNTSQRDNYRETAEEQVEISDLPETEDQHTTWAAQFMHKWLHWQHTTGKSFWRRTAIPGIVMLSIIAVLLIIGNIASSSTFLHNLIAPEHQASKVQHHYTLRSKPLTIYKADGAIDAIAVSPDASRLAVATQTGAIEIWNITSGQRLLTYRGHHAEVRSLTWSPDSTRIASADDIVQIWDADSGQHLLSYSGQQGDIYSVSWSPDGTRVVSAGTDGSAQIWDAHTGKHILTYHSNSTAILSAAWSPDGTRIASGGLDWQVHIWDAHTGKTLLTYSQHKDVVTSIAWSSDGERIASGGQDTTVQIWNTHTGKHILTYRGQTNTVYTIAWAPDNNHIASGGAGNRIYEWNAHSSDPLLAYASSANSLAWLHTSHGIRLISGGKDGIIKLWQAV